MPASCLAIVPGCKLGRGQRIIKILKARIRASVLIGPLRLIFSVMIKCQLAASVRAVPTLATERYSLCGKCFAYDDISTQVATVSSAVAGMARTLAANWRLIIT